MVSNWYPEPPRDADDRMTGPSQIVMVETDESDDEGLGNAPQGYELLSQAPQLGLSSSDEDAESDVEGVENSSPSSGIQNNTASTPDRMTLRQQSEVEEVDRLYSTPALRTEINVDCDQVRAAMVGFSLPPSSFPEWAANIPDSQLAATLTQHIQRIQSSSSNVT